MSFSGRTLLRGVNYFLNEDVDWIKLVQHRDSAEHGNETSGSREGGEFLD
jgi:hypothetical protein